MPPSELQSTDRELCLSYQCRRHHRQKKRERSYHMRHSSNPVQLPEEVYSSMGMHNNMVHPSNVVSPYDHPQFISYQHASTTSTTYHHQHHHELHFPVLDDDAIAKANYWSMEQVHTNSILHSSRVEKRQHLNEIITRPAQSRLLPFSIIIESRFREKAVSVSTAK